MKQSYLKNVSTLVLDETKCRGCGACMDVCPHAVFEPHEGKVRVRDRDACMECGACAGNCPFGAIEVHKGVGCAVAILNGMLHHTEPTCGCSD